VTRPQRRARTSRVRRAACALSRSPARSRRGSPAREPSPHIIALLSIEPGTSRTPELCGRGQVFPCRAQRAPTTTSPALEQHAARARASTVFGEDRRRAAPQGRAPGRVFPCRAQRAPTTTSPALEQHATRARASTVFGEDRRRAAPQGRAPASWGIQIRARARSGRCARQREVGVMADAASERRTPRLTTRRAPARPQLASHA
jgi:hypothetical protein